MILIDQRGLRLCPWRTRHRAGGGGGDRRRRRLLILMLVAVIHARVATTLVP